MLGVIVCTHSNLAFGLKDSIEMITGPQQDFDVVGFQEGEDMLSLSERLKKIAAGYEERKQRYVLLVDLFGATPFNAGAAGLATYDTSIITGVNLPLLLELITGRSSMNDYDQLLENALKSAQSNMQMIKMREMFQK